MERRYSTDSEVSACTMEDLMEEEEEEEVEDWEPQVRAPVKRGEWLEIVYSPPKKLVWFVRETHNILHKGPGLLEDLGF